MKRNVSVDGSKVLKLDTAKSNDRQGLDVTGRVNPTGNALKIDQPVA